MTISVLQEREASTGVAASSISIALSSTVTSGSSIHAFAATADAQTCTVADNVNGSYGTALDAIDDTTAGERISQYKFDNSAAGTITVTSTFSASTGFSCVWAREIGGTSGYDGAHHAQLQANPVSTATDGLTSGTATPGVQPGLISALSDDTFANNGPSTGTGFTAGITGWTFGAGGFTGRTESKRYTALTAIAATFTTATSTDNYITMAAFFKEAVSFPPVPGSPNTLPGFQQHNAHMVN